MAAWRALLSFLLFFWAVPWVGAAQETGTGHSLPTDDNRVLLVRGDHNYPPYEYLDAQGRPAGFNVAIIQAVAEAMGMQVRVELGPWDEVRAQLERGEIDALIGMFHTEERDRQFDFSIPHFVASYAVFVRQGSPIRSLDDARNTAIIVQSSDLGHDYVREHNLTDRIITKQDWAEVLTSLAKGEGDCAIVSRLQGTRLIERLGISGITPVGPPIIQRKYCLAVTEGNSSLLAKLNEGLSIIKENGRYDTIYHQWFGVYDEQSLPLVRMLRYGAFIVLLLLALVVAGLLWFRALRQQVNLRTAACNRELAERRQAEEALRASNELLSLFIRHSPIYAFIKEVSPTESRVLKASDNFIDMVGIRGSDMAGKTMAELFPPEFAKKITDDDWLVATSGEILRLDEELDGRSYTTIKFPIVLGGKNLLAGYTIDITERKQLEEQLLQSQKMESIGRLAGGVAHDFNNMLSVILGHTELALLHLKPTDPLHPLLNNVREAAQRSADLTRQLLTFARRQTIAPKVLELNPTVEGMLGMLRRLIGERIDLAWLPGRDAGWVRIDPSQIDQILVNLCLNSRDAISSTGRIVIETAGMVVDQAFCAAHPGFAPGEYLRLTVSDNGCGMDAAIRAHLFEPFFTTKETGKGTGLGLATVYGIVSQNNGFIEVDSEPGRGTTFALYLPRHQPEAVPPSPPGTEASAAGGCECILLVEDEPMILELATLMLGQLGYTVLAATSPGEALRLAGEHGGAIHLLLTDVIMPEMNGRDLAAQLRTQQPGLRTLYMSGYTADVIAHHGALDPGVHFMQKPFSMDTLAMMVRRALA